MEVGFIEVFPPRAASSRPPVLLQTLESKLLEAKNAAGRLASAGPHQQRDPQLADNLLLDSHRQVFQAFIEGFGEAYAPLLQQIKQSFDAAIEQGLADALQNSQLRLQLMEAHRQQAAAEAAVRADIIDGRQEQREQLYHAIAAAQARLATAQRRRDLAVKDLARAKSDLERCREAAKGSKATRQRLLDGAAAEANWLAARPHAATLLTMTAGPMSTEEDEELEAEMGVPLESVAPTHPLERALQLLEKHDAAAAAKLLEQHISGAGTGRRQQVLSALAASSTQPQQQFSPEPQQAVQNGDEGSSSIQKQSCDGEGRL